MIRRIRRLMDDRRGASRLVGILVILLLVMVGIIAVPYVRGYMEDSARIACGTALDTARRQLTTDYMLTINKGMPTEDEVKGMLPFMTYNGENLCPSGGTVYVIKTDEKDGMPYRLVCGLHDTDTKLCTRLNSSYVRSQVENAVRESRSRGVPYPETVAVELHGKNITAVLVDEKVNIRRGTSSTKDQEGIVVYYSIVGHSDFGAESDMDEGGVWYFSYADENHCANWTYEKSWEGDSYE